MTGCPASSVAGEICIRFELHQSLGPRVRGDEREYFDNSRTVYGGSAHETEGSSTGRMPSAAMRARTAGSRSAARKAATAGRSARCSTSRKS